MLVSVVSSTTTTTTTPPPVTDIVVDGPVIISTYMNMITSMWLAVGVFGMYAYNDLTICVSGTRDSIGVI